MNKLKMDVEVAAELVKVLKTIDTGECENFTSGYGSCVENGRTPDAKCLADKVCDSCIVHEIIGNIIGETI